MATITELYNTATEGDIVGQATSQWISKQLQSYNNFKDILTSLLADDNLGYEDMTEQELLDFVNSKFPNELLNQRYAYAINGKPAETTISLRDIAYSYLWSAHSELSPSSYQNGQLVQVDDIVEQINDSQEMLQAANQALLTIIDAQANDNPSNLVSEYYARLSMSLGNISDISANVGDALITSLSPALSTKDKVNGVLNMLGITDLPAVSSLDSIPKNNFSGITGVNAWSALGTVVSSGLDAIKSVGSQIMANIGSAVNNVLGSAWTNLRKSVGTVITTSDAYNVTDKGKFCFADYGRSLALYKRAYQDHLSQSDIEKLDTSLSNNQYACFDALGSYIYIWRDNNDADRGYYMRILLKVIPSKLMAYAFGNNYQSGNVAFNHSLEDDIISYGKIADNLFSVTGDSSVYEGLRNGIELTCHYLANIHAIHAGIDTTGGKEIVRDALSKNLFPQYSNQVPSNPTNFDIVNLITNGEDIHAILYGTEEYLANVVCQILKDMFIIDEWCPYFHTNEILAGRYSVMTDAQLATAAFGACITSAIVVTGVSLGLVSLAMSKRVKYYKTMADAYKRTASKELSQGNKLVMKLCRRADFKVSLMNSLIGFSRITSKTLLFGAPGLIISALSTANQAMSNALSGSKSDISNVTLEEIRQLISG